MKPKTFKNKRREVLSRLADMKRRVIAMTNVFTVEGRVYLDEGGTRDCGKEGKVNRSTGKIRAHAPANA